MIDSRMRQPCACLPAGSSLGDAAAAIAAGRLRALIVTAPGAAVGVLDPWRLLEAFGSGSDPQGRLTGLIIGPVAEVAAGSSVAAARTLLAKSAAALVVVDPAGEPCGVVLPGDLDIDPSLPAESDRADGPMPDSTGVLDCELRLRDQQNLLDALIESLPLPVFYKDRDGRYLGCNGSFERAIGRSRGEIVGRTVFDMAPPEIAARYDEKDRELFAAPGSQEYEWVVQTPDRGTRKVVFHKASFHHADGSLAGLVGGIVDVTEIRATEQALATTNGRLKAALGELDEHRATLERQVAERTAELRATLQKLADTQFAMDRVGIGIYWTDAESGRVLHVNGFAAAMLGYAPDEMLHLTVPDIDPNFDAEQFRELVERIGRHGHARFDSNLRHRDGRLVPVEVMLYLQPGSPGMPSRFIAFVSDISARLQAELGLQRARQAAEAANVAKTTFLANMSHEIRTPLNAVLGMAQLIRDSGLTPRQTEMIGILEGAGAELLQMLGAILEFTRIEAEQCVLDEQTVDVAAIVAEVVAHSRQRAAARGLQIEAGSAALPAGLLGDPTRLRLALLNYVDNALKFTDAGSIRIACAVVDRGPHDVLLRFEVVDTGRGIGPEQLARLFAAFEQGDGSSTRRHGGTGIGLALTRRLAELMGGEAGATSAPGQGSCFWFTARLARGSGARSLEPDPQLLAAIRRDHRGRRVLVVDDDASERESLRALLDAAGIAVDGAATGEEAVRKALLWKYALVLMDLGLPGIDGITASGRIRALPGRSGLPIIAMTGRQATDDRRRCLAAGMCDFVAKPVVAARFYEALAHWLADSAE